MYWSVVVLSKFNKGEEEEIGGYTQNSPATSLQWTSLQVSQVNLGIKSVSPA